MRWDKPYPISVIAGNEEFLREREIRRGILIASKKFKIQEATEDGEVVDSMTVAATFGESTLVLVSSKDVSISTLQAHKENPSSNFKILVRLKGPLKDFPFSNELHAAHCIEYNTPPTFKGRIGLAQKFCIAESKKLGSEPMSKELASALVAAVGPELGILNFEMSKAMACARYKGLKVLTPQILKLTIRPSSELNMMALKDALILKDQVKILRALENMQNANLSSPIMILLRSKIGPVGLALEWLEVGILLRKGSPIEEISALTGIPEWKLKKETLPAIKRWGTSNLKKLIEDLGRIELQIFKGGPSPWGACVSSLMIRST